MGPVCWVVLRGPSPPRQDRSAGSATEARRARAARAKARSSYEPHSIERDGESEHGRLVAIEESAADGVAPVERVVADDRAVAVGGGEHHVLDAPGAQVHRVARLENARRALLFEDVHEAVPVDVAPHVQTS